MSKEKKCINCNESFESYKKERKFCSKQCAQNYKSNNRTLLLVCNFCYQEYKIIKSKSNNSLYCSKKCKDKNQEQNLLGDKNPNFANHKLLGVKRSEEDINKIIQGAKHSWETEDRKEKHKKWFDLFFSIHGYYPFHSEEARKKSYETRAKSISAGKVNQVTHGICGNYISTKTMVEEWYQSSYELIRMQELDLDINVKNWTKKHKINIKLSEKTWYIPDFLIELIDGSKILEEVKGYARDKDLFDKQIELANLYCKKNNMMYIINYMNHLRNGKNKN